MRRPHSIRVVVGAALVLSTALLSDGNARAQDAKSQSDAPGASLDEAVSTDTTNEDSVSTDGQVTVTVMGRGSDEDPAVRASFDDHGNATVEVNLDPVRVRELDQVPMDLRDTEPHLQGACIRTRTLMVPPELAASTYVSYEEGLLYSIQAIFPTETVEVPACTPRPGDDQSDAIAGVLATFVEQLPRPTPTLNPSKAVTGLDTYLQTNRPLARGPVTLTGGPFTVTLEALGSYTVDWGQQDDGPGEAFQRVTGPHVIPGRSYQSGRSPEDGAVTHVYTSVPDGPLEVSVTDYWTIHYSIRLAGTGTTVVDGATLVAELAPVTVPVEVREYQAVVVSQ